MEINFRIILCNKIMNMCKNNKKTHMANIETQSFGWKVLLSIFLYKNHVVNWFQLESARRGDS